jgi:hypothetical protein
MTQLEITELLRAATKNVELLIKVINNEISASLNPCIANYNLVLKLAEEYRHVTTANIVDKDMLKKWQGLELFEIEPVPLIEHISTQIANALAKFEVLPSTS